MFELLRLYLASILRPVFEDLQYNNQEEVSFGGDIHPLNHDSDQATSDDEADGEEEEGEEKEDEAEIEARSQVLSMSGSEWNNSQLATKSIEGAKVSITSKSNGKKRKKLPQKRTQSFDNSGLLDPGGPKLIHGVRSWLLMFQIVGQINWMGVPFYLSLIYKAFLFAIVVYICLVDFIEPTMEAHIIDSNYRNPILMFIGALAIVTTLLHALVTIYTNLFKLCPLFKVLTTPRLCFIKREVQHIVGNKSLFFMLIFHVYQCILLQMLSLPSLNEFVNQFQVGRFILDSFVIIVLTYFFNGIIHIDFYVRICFGFWIIAMKKNLEYRFAYLQRLNRLNRIVGSDSTASDKSLRAQLQTSKGTTAPLGSGANVEQQAEVSECSFDDHVREATLRWRSESVNVGAAGKPGGENQSQISLDTNLTNNTTTMINNYNKKRRPTTAQSGGQITLNSFRDKYKLDTMDEIQKNLNTMDDHLEVCRGIQNGSLVLITLNAFLTNGTLLLIAYHLLANQGKNFHGVIMILLVANNTLLVFLCYIGDSWISYALGSFVQIVEDEYFLQGGDDCTSVKQPPMEPKGSLPASRTPADSVLPLNWSSRLASENGDATSETLYSFDLTRKDQQLFMIRKKDVLFCREFLHQFENHLATPWSKLTVKIHLHMLGTFVTLIAAQIIFDREH